MILHCYRSLLIFWTSDFEASAVVGTYNFCLIATANGCKDTVCQPLTVISLVMKAGSRLIVSVFPNPSNGLFQLETGVALCDVLTDAQGKLLSDRSYDSGTLSIDVGSVAEGVYMMMLSNETSSSWVNLVKINR